MENWVSKIRESNADLKAGKYFLDEVCLECNDAENPIRDIFVINKYMGLSDSFDLFLNTYSFFTVDFHIIYGASNRHNLLNVYKRFKPFNIPREFIPIGHDCGSDPFLMSKADGAIYRFNRDENNTLSFLADSFSVFMDQIVYGNDHAKLYPNANWEDIEDEWTDYLILKGWLKCT